MRNRYRSAYHEGHIKRIQELFARHSDRRALFNVIGDAVIATQNDRCGQSHQLFGLLIECTIFVGLRIEREKPFDAEVVAAEQLLVHGGAVLIELVHGKAIPFRFFATVPYGEIFPESIGLRRLKSLTSSAAAWFHSLLLLFTAVDDRTDQV